MGQILLIGSELGILIAFPMVICIVSGVYLDRIFGTSPWLLVSSILLGLLLTIADVYKLVLPFLEKKTRQNKDDFDKGSKND
jgi:F0F1-type ATP synthase assembly protein I